MDEFIHILGAEGVTVRRPAVMNFSVTFKTPHWQSKGFCSACPRDGLLAVGDEIIGTPMAWRSRYFEVDAHRLRIKECTAGAALARGESGRLPITVTGWRRVARIVALTAAPS
jgi:glycine amidinotransferase